MNKLYQKLDIENLKDLEEATQNDEIQKIKGFGKKTQQNILNNLELAKQKQERMLLGDIDPIAQNLLNQLKKHSSIKKVEIVGSFRRHRPTIGDIDILATAENSEEAMNAFCNLEDVDEVLQHGEKKSSIRISTEIQVDLRIIEEPSWGSALMYFTGSKDHNISLRQLARDKGYKLNEYGLFKREMKTNPVASKTEEEVFSKLDLDFIPPTLREDFGEIDLAAAHKMPTLIQLDDIRGDCQLHTTYSDGKMSIEEAAQKAEKLGYNYIVITDHDPTLAIATGPASIEELQEQRDQIARVSKKCSLDILQGLEVEITKEGIQISEKMLEILDIIGIAVHSELKDPTEKIIDCFESYPVNYLIHPFNRKLLERPGWELDMDQIVKSAKKNHVALEINAQPSRLDLPWNYVHKYKGDVKFIVNTDAHSVHEMEYMRYGVGQAQRGWLEKEDILNTSNLNELKE